MPDTVDPCTEVSGEHGVIMAQPIGQKQGNVRTGEAVAETVQKRHGIGGLARSNRVGGDELGQGVDGKPEPRDEFGTADLGTEFIELQDFRREVVQEGVMEMVGMCAEAVESTGDGVIVNAKKAGNVGARHPEGKQHKGGLCRRKQGVLRRIENTCWHASA